MSSRRSGGASTVCCAASPADGTTSPAAASTSGGGINTTTTPSAAAAARQKAPWTYKYRRSRGPSPCAPDDTFCCQLEALIQNVLAYPYTPPRIHRRLDQLRPLGIDAVTDTVERMAEHFGAELALAFLRRQPELLELDFPTIDARARELRATLHVPEHEVPLLLHKNPGLLALEPAELRARFEALPRVLRFSPLQVHALVTKYPLVLSRRTDALQYMVGQLHHLARARSQWQDDADAITPSLLAFFLKDFGDQVRVCCAVLDCAMLCCAALRCAVLCWGLGWIAVDCCCFPLCSTAPLPITPPLAPPPLPPTPPPSIPPPPTTRCAAWSTWPLQGSPPAST